MTNIFFLLALLIFSMTASVSALSFFEREVTAGKRLLLLSFLTPLPFLIVGFLNIPVLSVSILIFLIILLTIVFFPSLKTADQHIQPVTQIDERDIMFSRDKLTTNPQNYTQYYKDNPEKKARDDNFRQNPGLLSRDTKFYELFPFAAADANFSITKHFHDISGPAVNPTRQNVGPKSATHFIANWLRKNGAVDVGFGKLEKYHLYSHHGYAKKYGKVVDNNHKFAIAFLVEMDKEMMSTAPYAPVVMESSQQYLKAGILAVTVAKFISNLGYSARAHIDGKYDLIAPLVARDCGLGEIGRMGILISNQMGPRVRIAVITTDMPVKLTQFKPDLSVEEFCRFCKKCATVCPSMAIPFEDKKPIHGIKRWQIDQEKCFHFWTKTGTDCGRCMQVCPYSHANNLFHKSVRFMIKHFPVFRRLAIYMDDLIYGRKPVSKKTFQWMENNIRD